MVACIKNNGGENGGKSQGNIALQAGERYFDDNGLLLVGHYSFIYDRIADAAKRHNKDLSWLRPDDSFEKRRAAAKAKGWETGGAYCRCSTNLQDSYLGQMASCIDKAVANNVIIFPEMSAGDEDVTGKKSNRSGIEAAKEWARASKMTVFVAFSISRLFRRSHKGLQFVREDILEQGIRVLAVAENRDSLDKQFSTLLNFDMMIAEMQASALPEFVRMGQKAHFENGFLIGACPLGYRPVPVPEAGLTKKGKVKTKPEVVPEVVAIIRRAYERVAGGTTISQACRLYNQDVTELPEEVRQFAVDPRSTTGIMRPEAFRKMLSRRRYIGEWNYGVLRNQWLDKKNTTIQVKAPEHEVVAIVNNALRIVSDELFHKVQTKLAEGQRGKHGPRTGREATLATTLTGMYFCAECGHVFHYYGMKYMHCPESRKGDCKNWGTVEREQALAAIIEALRARMLDNPELVAEIVRQSHELDSELDKGNFTERIGVLEKAIRRQTVLMAQIEQSCGDEGMDEDDLARHKAAKSEKSRLQAELAALKTRVAEKRKPISEAEVLSALKDFDSLLAAAASGELGPDSKQRAAALIRDLVGGEVKVSFNRLQGRRAFGVGRFTPNPVLALARGKNAHDSMVLNLPSVSVEFRKLPRYHRIADEVYRLYTEEGLTFTEIGKRFEIGSGNAWGAFAYWHTSRGLPIPYKNERSLKKDQEQAS